jgi:hypothetical protein
VTALTDVVIQPQVEPVADEGQEGEAEAPPADAPAPAPAPAPAHAPAPAPAPAPAAATPPIVPKVEQRALIAKMHGNAVDSRRRKIEEQELNLTKMWPLVYGCMSPQS